MNAQTGTVQSGAMQVYDLGSWWLVAAQVTNNTSGNTLLVARLILGSGIATDVYLTQILLANSRAHTLICAANTTRQADQISSLLSADNLPSVGPYTFRYEWGLTQKPSSGNRNYIFSVDDTTANNRIAMFIDSSGFLNGEIIAAGGQEAIITGASDVSGGGTAVFSIATNDVQLAANGVSVGTDTNCTLPIGLTTWRHGCDQAGANQLDGPIKRETAWSARI